MPQLVAIWLFHAVDRVEPFVQKVCRVTNKLGIRPLVRFGAALRIIEYGDAANMLDEHLQISETSANNTLKSFYKVVVSKFRFF